MNGSSSAMLEAERGAAGGVPGAAGGALPGRELEDAVRPMLAAVVTMAGASGGAARLAGLGAARSDLVVGLPQGVDARGAIAAWCGRCSEWRDPASNCMRASASVPALPCVQTERVCAHIVELPLRYRGSTVGALDLHFERARELPQETMLLLRATGELIGVVLENARLTRENFQASLASERQLMAGEVHDALAQSLTYMRMRMAMLTDAIRQGDTVRAFKCGSDVDASLTEAHARLRELITSFRTGMDPEGLQHALAGVAGSFFERTGIVLDYQNRAPDLRMSAAREVQAYFVVQEALANVCRHARAGRVTLSVDRVGDRCEIVVADDGVGFAEGGPEADREDSGHYGISIMRERASRLGGELTIERGSAGGTCVRLAFPLERAVTGRAQ